MAEQGTTTNKPPGDAFRQQKLPAWQPIMTPLKVVIIFLVIGIAFIPTGTSLLKASNDVYEHRIMYDGSDQSLDCSITSQNEGRICPMTFTFDKDVNGPVMVYYELENFYQNHRRYVSSIDTTQLQGASVSKATLETTCEELVTNGSLIMNPCGLIANSFFTDVFTLTASSPAGLIFDETGISWRSDDDKFKQPSGFQAVSVGTFAGNTCTSVGLPANCKTYTDPSSGQNYFFYYPNDDAVQYLYESYPLHISPIDGVTDEHFKVWMRPAALPKFRKLYGKIDHDFKKGDSITFQVNANFEVNSFDGSKSILISNLGEFGGKNPFLGVAFIVVGAISLMFAMLFIVKQTVAPRAKADASLLNWS